MTDVESRRPSAPLHPLNLDADFESVKERAEHHHLKLDVSHCKEKGDWFKSVCTQLKLQCGRLSQDAKFFLEKLYIGEDKYIIAYVIQEVDKWLKDNADTPFRPGAERRRHCARVPEKAKYADWYLKFLKGKKVPKEEELTVQTFCSKRYGIDLAEYRKKFRDKKAPSYELATFALSRINWTPDRSSTHVRVSLLRSQQFQSSTNKHWEVWDKEERLPNSDKINLNIAYLVHSNSGHGNTRFYPLEDKAKEDPEAEGGTGGASVPE